MRRDRDLDRELRDLGRGVEYPPTPDLAGSVRGRIEAEAGRSGPSPRTRPQLWWIAAAALALLVAVPVLSLALRDTGTGAFSAGGGDAGGAAGSGGGGSGAEPARPPENAAAEPTRLVGSEGSLAAGAVEDGAEGGAQETLEDSGGAAGQGRNRTGPVPDVVGMGLTAACEKLSSREYVGYVTRTADDPSAGSGVVVEQSPRAGRGGLVGDPVDLTVSEPYPKDELRRLSRGRNPACLDVTH